MIFDTVATIEDLDCSAVLQNIDFNVFKNLENNLSLLNVRLGITDENIYGSMIVGVGICTMPKFLTAATCLTPVLALHF